MKYFFLAIGLLYFIFLFDLTISWKNNSTGITTEIRYNGLVWSMLEGTPILSFKKYV